MGQMNQIVGKRMVSSSQYQLDVGGGQGEDDSLLGAELQGIFQDKTSTQRSLAHEASQVGFKFWMFDV